MASLEVGVSYTPGAFLLPPRPENAIPKGLLPYYEERGWAAQVKKNGTCSEVFVASSGHVSALTRHGGPHRAWAFTEGSRAVFRRMPEGDHVLVAELMHSKVSNGARDTLYIHDILVFCGLHLVGSTYEERYDILKETFLAGRDEETLSHWVLTPHAWLARNHFSEFARIFASLTGAEDEGLVLKDPQGVLSFRGNEKWQVKCRKGTKNYGF